MESWSRIVEKLENPEPVKRLYVSAVQHLSQNTATKDCYRILDSHFFFRLYKVKDEGKVLTFESPGHFDFFFGVVKSQNGVVQKKINLNASSFENRMGELINAFQNENT